MEKFNIHESMMELPGSPGFPTVTNENEMENVENMTEEQKRKLETERALAKSRDDMSQLVDRIATNSFQG